MRLVQGSAKLVDNEYASSLCSLAIFPDYQPRSKLIQGSTVRHVLFDYLDDRATKYLNVTIHEVTEGEDYMHAAKANRMRIGITE